MANQISIKKMGKGTIKSGGTDGLYTIDIVRDVTTAQARKATLEQRSLDLADQITAAEAEKTQAKASLDAAINTVDTLIDAYSQLESPSETALEAINTAVKAASDAAIIYNEIDRKYKNLVLDKASVDKEISDLETVEGTIETSAWCADYTEDLTGDVGTVEIPGERTYLLIRPGDAGAAVYSASRDGILHPAHNGSYAGVWYNWTMFPGWQKWVPQYRRGQITAIDEGANTCTVDILGGVSTADRLNVNYLTSSSDVPIEYMTCDHAAFTLGDIVLIEFENVTSTGIENNWANPKVVGFIDNPKECPVVFGYRVQPNPGCETADSENCWNGWGAPFDDGGDPPTLINPPWGTIESGSRNQSLLVQQSGTWQHWRDPQTQTWSSNSGTVDWQGNGMLCGWYGGDQGSRYRIHGSANWVSYQGTAVTVPNQVHGACIREFNGEKYIISVSDTNQATIVNTTRVDGTIQWQTDASHGVYDLSGEVSTGSFWLFNADGTEAVQIREKIGTGSEHTPCTYGFPVWRRKMRLTVSLRVGGGGLIVPDITLTDLGDEMATRVSDPPVYTYHDAPIGTVATVDQCTGPNGTIETNNIQGWLDDEWWEEYTEDSFSYKFYDYKGNVEVSAEFWNTRQMYVKEWASPPGYGYLPDVECNGGGLGYRPTGTFDNWPDCVVDTHLVGIEGDSTLKCGVRFTGGGGTDIEHTAINQCRGSGNSVGSFPTNTHTVSVTTTATVLSFAVPYMDMRFGQLIAVLEKRILDRLNTKTSYDPCEEPAQQEADLYGIDTWTTNLKIDIYTNGSIVNTEEREDVVVDEYEPDRFFFWNPRLDLYWPIHRKCRGFNGTAVVPDYLFQSRQKDPRPMASAGGNSYCVSYVDRWVKYDEENPLNEDVPPIRSVLSNYPIALNIPGTFPNAAPVTPVEPKAGG